MEKEKSFNHKESKPFKDIEWKSLKTSFFCILIILFVFFATILIFGISARATFPKMAQATDLGYTFNQDLLYTSQDDNNSISFYKTYNLKDRIVQTNNYTASFNFTTDTIGSEPSQFHVYGIGGFAHINASIETMNKVLYISDKDTSNRINVMDTITDKTFGTIEFWWYLNDTSERSFIRMLNNIGISNETCIRIRNEGTDLEYYDSGWFDSGLDITANIWNHIRIDFCGFGTNYLGMNPLLTTAQFRIILNGQNSSIFDWNVGTAPDIDYILFRSYTTNTNEYFQAIDNIGYSWKNKYTIGLNTIPYSYKRPKIQDVAHYDFYLEAINNLHDVGDDNPYGWNENDDATDGVNIALDSGTDFDRLITVDADDGDTYGIYKTFTELNNYNYNITYSLDIRNVATQLFTEVNSNDATNIVLIRLFSGSDMTLQFYDGSGYIELDTGLSYNTKYEFNLYMNQYHGNVILRVKEIGGSLFGVYDFPYIVQNKNGIARINIYGESGVGIGNEIDFDIDYIGIFENGISVNNDFAFTTVSLDTQYWNRAKHYLMDIKATGYFRLYKHYKFGVNESYYDNIESIFFDNLVKFDTYDNTTKFINVYDDSGGLGFPEVVFIIKGSNFTCNYLNINGVILEQNSNDFVMEFNSGNINPNETYFYVEGNRLKWNYESDDNSKLEYIQATFSIESHGGVNRSVRFVSRYNGSNYGYFYTNYTDGTISIFDLFPFRTTQALLLSNLKIINGFTILITDNNEPFLLNASGECYGIRLNYLPTYYTQVSTVNLFTAFAPLIILIVPTMLVYFRIGKIAILPMLILMTVICFIGLLIPNWLFFILLMVFGTLLVLQQKFSEND